MVDALLFLQDHTDELEPATYGSAACSFTIACLCMLFVAKKVGILGFHEQDMTLSYSFAQHEVSMLKRDTTGHWNQTGLYP